MDHRGNEVEAGYADQSEIATPTTNPAAGFLRTYAKSDDNLYKKNSAGVEALIGGGGSNIHRTFKSATTTSGLYISHATNAAFDIGNPSKFTVRMWFRSLNNLGYNNGLATRGALGGTQGDWAVGFFNGASMKPTFRLNNNAVAAQSSTVITTGWHFLEFSYDSSLGSNNMKIFIDGVLDTQANYSTIISNNGGSLVVGTYFDNAHNMNGCISEFEFCAGFIRNTSGYTPPQTITPDAHSTVVWAMNEDVDAQVTDTSGNGFNGVLTGVYATDDPFRFF
jgi:concanavalin A-like lectin/glucanase superfamily protein